jgi:hypothetical protein
MLEIKVQCDCGQKYKFDVEPVDGRMPFVVNCPICGVNGTEKANQILNQIFPQPNVPAAPALALAAAPAAVAAAAAPETASLTPTKPPGPAKLRINLHKPEQPAVAHAPAALAPTAPSPRPALRPTVHSAAAVQAIPGKKPSFPLGVLGALVGSVVGSLVYFLIFKYTGLYVIVVKLLAVGVGYLAGAGAELLGRKEGSKELGVIAAVFTLVGLVGAQYFVALGWWHGASELLKPKKSAYEDRVAEAKKVMAAIPTGSDQEIRVYLAKTESEDSGEKIDPKSVTADEIKVFKESTLPEMQNLASGKLTKAEFEKQNGIDEEKDKKEADAEEGTFKAVFLLLLLSRTNLISLCAAAALAFKVCSDA